MRTLSLSTIYHLSLSAVSSRRLFVYILHIAHRPIITMDSTAAADVSSVPPPAAAAAKTATCPATEPPSANPVPNQHEHEHDHDSSRIMTQPSSSSSTISPFMKPENSLSNNVTDSSAPSDPVPITSSIPVQVRVDPVPSSSASHAAAALTVELTKSSSSSLNLNNHNITNDNDKDNLMHSNDIGNSNNNGVVCNHDDSKRKRVKRNRYPSESSNRNHLITIRVDAAHPDRSVRLIDTLIVDPELVLKMPIGGNAFEGNQSYSASSTFIGSSYFQSVHRNVGDGSISAIVKEAVDDHNDHSVYNIVDAIETFSMDMAGQMVADYEVNGTQRVTKHFNGRLKLLQKTDFVQKVATQIREPIMQYFFKSKLPYFAIKQEHFLERLELKVRLQNIVIKDEIVYDRCNTDMCNPIMVANSIANDLKAQTKKANISLPDETPVFIAAEIIRQLNNRKRQTEQQQLFSKSFQENSSPLNNSGCDVDYKQLTTIKKSSLDFIRSVDSKEVFAAEYKVLTECHPGK